jgi:hypothetical protein
MNFDDASLNTMINRILKNLRNFPAETASKIPVLTEIADISAGKAAGLQGQGSRSLLRKRLDRRYARVCVVHSELNKLNFKNARPGTGFDDFIFQQTDFDVYKQISAENFAVFFLEGLDDYDESFYKKNFMMDKEKLKALIGRSYAPAGDSYVCKTLNGKINPLLLGIVRTLHTSLEFLPLIGKEELHGETAILIRFLQSHSAVDEESAANLSAGFPALFGGFLHALNGAVVTHLDTMKTTLTVKTENGKPALYGTFRPGNKAFTIPLIPAD